MEAVIAVVFALLVFATYLIREVCVYLDENMQLYSIQHNDEVYTLFFESEVRDEKTMLQITKNAIDLGVVELLQFLVKKMTIEEKIEALEFTFVNKKAREASVILTSLARQGNLHQSLAHLYSKDLIGGKGLVSHQLTSLQSVQHAVELFEVVSYAEKNEFTLTKFSSFFLSGNLNQLIDAALLVSKYCGYKEQYDAIILQVTRGTYRYTGNDRLLPILASIVEKSNSNPMSSWKTCSDELKTYFRIVKTTI